MQQIVKLQLTNNHFAIYVRLHSEHYDICPN